MGNKFLTDVDISNNQINPVRGQQYFNTVDNTLYIYDGTNWIKHLTYACTFRDWSE